MKNNRYNNLFWILILSAFAIIGSNCKKSNLIGEYYLGDLIYSNPYQGTEMLIYKSSDGKEYSFKCLSRSRTTYESTVSVNSNDYYITEHDYTYFIDSTNEYRFGIVLKTNRYNQAEMGIGLSNYLLGKEDNYTSNSMFYLPLDKNNLKDGQEYHDSIAINGMFYYCVFSDQCELYFQSGNSSDTNQLLSVVYYNTAQGLVKLDFNNGVTWEIEEIQN
jgi:hypothetical protein